MILKLSASEKKAFNKAVLASIRSRFPHTSSDIKRLHAVWPQPRPPQAALYMLTHDPASYLLNGQNSALFLGLPDVVQWPAETLYEGTVYSHYQNMKFQITDVQKEQPIIENVVPVKLSTTEALQKAMDRVVEFKETAREKISVIQITTNSDGTPKIFASREDLIVFMQLATQQILRTNDTDVYAKIAEAAVERMISGEVVILPNNQEAEKVVEDIALPLTILPPVADEIILPAPVANASPSIAKPQKTVKAVSAKNAAAGSEFLTNSQFLTKYGVGLLEAFAANNLETEKQLRDFLAGKGIERNNLSRILNYIFTGSIFDSRSNRKIDAINPSVAKVLEAFGLSADEAFGQAIQERRLTAGEQTSSVAAKVVTKKPDEFIPEPSKIETAVIEAGKANASLSEIVAGENAKDIVSEPNDPASRENETQADAKKLKRRDSSKILLADADFLKSNCAALYQAFVAHGLTTKKQVMQLLIDDGMHRFMANQAVDALLSGDRLFNARKPNTLIAGVPRICEMVGLTSDQALDQLIGARQRVVAPIPASAAVRDKVQSAPLANSEFLQKHGIPLLEAFASQRIRTEKELEDFFADQMRAKGKKTVQRLANDLVSRIVDGRIFDNRSGRKYDDITPSVAGAVDDFGFSAKELFATVIQERNKGLQELLSQRMQDTPKTVEEESSTNGLSDDGKAKRRNSSKILLADSDFLRLKAPNLLLAFTAHGIENKKQAMKLLTEDSMHRFMANKALDELLSGDVLNLNRRAGKGIRIKASIARICEKMGLTPEEAFGATLDGAQIAGNQTQAGAKTEALSKLNNALPPSIVPKGTKETPANSRAHKPPPARTSSATILRGGLRHLSPNSFVLSQRDAGVTKPILTTEPPVLQRKQESPTSADLDNLWTEFKASHSVLTQALGEQTIEGLYERVLVRIGGNYDRARFYTQLQDLTQGALNPETRQLKPIAKVIHLAIGFTDDITVLFPESAKPSKIKAATKRDHSDKLEAIIAVVSQISDARSEITETEANKQRRRNKKTTGTLIANSEFLARSCPEVLRAFLARGIENKGQALNFFREQKVKAPSSGISDALDRLIGGDIFIFEGIPGKPVDKIEPTVAKIIEALGIDVDQALAKAKEEEREQRKLLAVQPWMTPPSREQRVEAIRAARTASEIILTPDEMPNELALDDNRPPASPMVKTLVELGFESSDAEILVDMGIDSYEAIVSTLDDETIDVLGLSTKPAIVHHAVELSRQRLAGEPQEFILIPLHPHERKLNADSNLGEWSGSGLSEIQIHLLSDEEVNTIGDLSEFSYEDLTDALGNEDFDPEHGTDLILRAKLITHQIDAAEYTSMRTRWLSTITNG